jgi:putative tryptophan/tyrosine transport system substrate-binding protein
VDRRQFLQTVTVSLLGVPLAVAAQPPGKVWRIGFLSVGQKINAPQVLQPFLDGMRQLGYVEGKNLRVEVSAAEGHPEDLRALAAQVVRAKPDVIVVGSAGHAAIVQKVTKTLPIVTLAAGELGSSGLVASLTKPGGNLTGMQLYSPELMGKRIQILQEVVPSLRRLAVLRNTTGQGSLVSAHRQATDEAAAKLGIKVHYVVFQRPDQLPALFTEMATQRDDALLIWANPTIGVLFDRIQELATRHRLPAVHEFGSYVRRGGLIAYGPKLQDVFRQAATYVDRIFKGANPGDLPIGQPTTFELLINLKTAKALGLTIPPSVLQQADQVIE